MPSYVVCSKHFITGKPSGLEDDLNPDWVPTVNMGYKKKASDISRFKRLKTRLKRQIPEEVSESSGSLEVKDDISVSQETDHDTNMNRASQTDLDLAELSLLFNKLSASSATILELQKKTLCCNNLKDDNNLTKYYTGLPKYKAFEVVVKCVKPFIKVHGKIILPPEEQILLSLVKLRLNSDFKDLAQRFGISPSTAPPISELL